MAQERFDIAELPVLIHLIFTVAKDAAVVASTV
jgi:hypothetical protein